MSHLLREKVSNPRALALKADELYQSRVSYSMLNLLSEDLQGNLVSSRTPRSPISMKSPPLSKRSPTPAPTSRSPTPSGLCWYHKKPTTVGNLVPFGETSSPAGGYSHPTCWSSSCCFSSGEVLQLHPPFSERKWNLSYPSTVAQVLRFIPRIFS